MVAIGLPNEEAKGKLLNRLLRCSHDYLAAFIMVKIHGTSIIPIFSHLSCMCATHNEVQCDLV